MLEIYIFAGAVIVIALPWLYWAICPNGSWFKFGLDKRYHPKAGIANTLYPLVNKHITSDTTIKIIGSRCRNLQDGNEKNDTYPNTWTNKLQEWASTGKKVEYLLIEPDESSWNRLKGLKDKHQNIHAYRIGSIAAIADERVKKLAEECLTSHFALFDYPRQMWLEGNHPLDSNEAYDCEFVDKQACSDDWRFPKLTSVFEELKTQAQASRG